MRISTIATIVLLLRIGPGVRAEDSPVRIAELRDRGFVPLFDGTSLASWDLQPWHRGHWVVRDGVLDYDGKAEHKNFKKNTLWSTASYGDVELYVEWRMPSPPKTKPHPIVLPNGDFVFDENGKRKTKPGVDAGDSGIYLRGDPQCQANIWSQLLGSGEINGYRTNRKLPDEIRKACLPSKRADKPFGEWNTFLITMRGDRMTVVLNGERVIDGAKLPGVPACGPIGLQHHGDPVQFRNILINPLVSKSE